MDNQLTIETDTHLRDVLAAPDGPQIGALFDFDGTIIAGYSATAMLQEKFRRREMSPEEMITTLNVIMQYSTGGMGFSGLMSSAARFLKGVSEDSYYDFGEELYEKHIARKIYPESRALIEAHLAKGHSVAIVSSATIYQIEATARDLGIEYACCSRYKVENGEFTGEIQRPLCFGEGKVIAAEKLAKQVGFDLDHSFFYTDSDDDIELLERVGKPRILNPNFRLERIAGERGWPVQNFSSRGRANALDYTRTISATGSLVTSFLAGLPIWAMTGSQREGINFAIGMFGDIATAISGVELDIHGENNLWAHRPCVFIFNHQSKADIMIMAKLIRKDIAGVAKKEIRDTPVIGGLMEMAGTIFIDRANAKSAIAAMQPLVDAIRADGKSICIAPEGTRTLTPKLAPFKKGAFHLAMQAGVPIVPVVIHNASDVAPKGEFIIRPAKVRVDVLPPVSTKGWTLAQLNRHIQEVRAMFLEALGQSEEEALLQELKDNSGHNAAAQAKAEEPAATPAPPVASKAKKPASAAKPKKRPAKTADARRAKRKPAAAAKQS